MKSDDANLGEKPGEVILANGKHRRVFLLLALTYVGFVSLGLPDGMFGVAWPSMRRQFLLPLDAVGSVLFVFTCGYLLSSFSSGRILARVNIGVLLAASAGATAFSLLGYAFAPVWLMIVGLALFAGLGAGAIDAGLNTYAATNHSPRTVTWLHASYGLGAAAGPMFLAWLLTQGTTWQMGYIWVGIGEAVLALCFIATRSWWPASHPPEVGGGDAPDSVSMTLMASLRQAKVRSGVFAFFVYTGLEASVGTWAFTFLTAQHGLSPLAAGRWTAAFWGCLAAGRVIAGILTPRFSQAALLRAGVAILSVGAALTCSQMGANYSTFGIVLLGLGLAPLFPGMIASTPQRVEAVHTQNAVGFQIAAATLGQSVFPAIIGHAAAAYGLRAISILWCVGAAALLALIPIMTPVSGKRRLKLD